MSEFNEYSTEALLQLRKDYFKKLCSLRDEQNLLEHKNERLGKVLKDRLAVTEYSLRRVQEYRIEHSEEIFSQEELYKLILH